MKLFQTVVFCLILCLSGLVSAQEKVEMNGFEPVKQVKLFPNPAIEYLNVKFETPQAKKATFILHNIIGNAVEIEKEVIDDYEVKIKVKDLSTGFYLLLVHNEETGLKGAYKFLKK